MDTLVTVHNIHALYWIQVKSYATSGGKLESWDTPHIGYTVEENADEYAYLFLLGPPIALLIFFYVFSITLFLSEWFQDNVLILLLEKSPGNKLEDTPKNGLKDGLKSDELVSVVLFLIILTNLAYYVTDFICFIYLASKTKGYTNISFWLRNTLHYVSVGIAFIVAAFITVHTGGQHSDKANNSDNQQITNSDCNKLDIADSNLNLSDAVIYISYMSYPLAFLPFLKNKFLYFHAVWACLIFVNIIIWNFVPIVALFFVRLVLTFAIFSLILSLFVLVAVFTTYLVYSFAKSGKHGGIASSILEEVLDVKDSKWRLVIKVCCWPKFWFGLFAVALLLFVVTILLMVYILIVYKGATDGGMTGFVISALLPTAVTAMATYFGKQLLDNVVENRADDGPVKSDDSKKTD